MLSESDRYQLSKMSNEFSMEVDLS
jgi:hypothetical protein